MKIRVNPHNVEIVREETEPINELEVKVSKCEFEFAEEITNDFVKEAYFTLNGSTYKQIIVNNECDYPNEVLTETGTLEIGVVAYKVENGEELIRYNPSPDYYDTWEGSLKDAENSEPLTPTDKEQMQSQISQNASDISDLQANKQDNLTAGDNITIENNVISAVDTIYDDTEIKQDITDLQNTKVDKVQGKGLSTNDYTNDEKSKLASLENYDDTEVKTDISNLKTNKADKSEIPTKVSQLQNDSGFITNAVNDLINYYLKSETYTKSEVNDLISAISTLDLKVVETLPTEDISTTTIYLVPKASAGTNDAYDEYIYVSNNWEFIGSTQVDLTDYVKNTDYATNTTGGVIKYNSNTYGSYVINGFLGASQTAYQNYLEKNNNFIIGKGTLENVIEGKGLTTKAYVDGLVGDISSVIDAINGEVI